MKSTQSFAENDWTPIKLFTIPMFTLPKYWTMYTILLKKGVNDKRTRGKTSSTLGRLVTCLPSCRHWDGEGLCSLAAGWRQEAGPRRSVGFSIVRVLRSFTRGRYTVPSWALHRRTRMDRGQPLSRDRTAPAWERREANTRRVCRGCDWRSAVKVSLPGRTWNSSARSR